MHSAGQSCMQSRLRAASRPHSSGAVEQAGRDQLCAVREQLLSAQAAMPADAGLEQAGACTKLEYDTSPAHCRPVTEVHARSFDTWMASHQPPADMRRCAQTFNSPVLFISPCNFHSTSCNCIAQPLQDCMVSHCIRMWSAALSKKIVCCELYDQDAS